MDRIIGKLLGPLGIVLLLGGIILAGPNPLSAQAIPPELIEQYKKQLQNTSKGRQSAPAPYYSTPQLYSDSIGLSTSSETHQRPKRRWELPGDDEELFLTYKQYIVIGSDTIQTIVKPAPRDLPRFGIELFGGATIPHELFFDTLRNNFYSIDSSGGEDDATAASTHTPPSATAPISDDYILGPGDEIIVNMWGGATQEYHLIVDREGQVIVPEAGNVSVGGLSLSQTREAITQLLTSSYSDIQVGVLLAKVKNITVFVVGWVKQTNQYSLSSLSSVLNAVAAAGGPQEHGSLRNIELLRNNRVQGRLDLYELLTNGTPKENLLLASGDVVRVSSAKRLVTLRGRVRRPAVYELIEGEGAAELLRYAGGPLPDAYLEQVMVDRVVDGQHRIVTFDFRVGDTTGKKPELLDGDDVSIFPVPTFRENAVWLTGMVTQPGIYEWRESLRVSELLDNGRRLLPVAYRERLDILRTRPDLQREIIVVNIDSALTGNPNNNLLLKPGDRLTVHSVWDMKKHEYVGISGAVNREGRYPFYTNMHVSDLIFAAGGFSEHAQLESAELGRLGQTKQDNQVISVDLTHIFQNHDSEADLLLKPDDQVLIRVDPLWAPQEVVTITGEVQNPGQYFIHEQERLSSIIKRCGGFTAEAFWDGAEFIRPKLGDSLRGLNLFDVMRSTQEYTVDSVGRLTTPPILFEVRGDRLKRLILDFQAVVERGDTTEDIILRGGDSIFVPRTPSGVSVLGQVAASGTMRYIPGQTVEYYVEKAGGATRNGDLSELRLLKANGKVFQTKLSSREVGPGDAIIIPGMIRERVNWLSVTAQVVTIISSLFLTAFMVSKL